MTLCDRGEGGGSAERYVTPKIFYMYNIILYYLYYCLLIHNNFLFIQCTILYMYYYEHVRLHTRR